MIPKIIHYCWFGNGDMPKLTLKCIESWRQKLPDYELRLWSEKEFDINSVKFVKEAYSDRNFAFVSDYIRAYALYNYGGIYLDTDVELLRNLDRFLTEKVFVGFEEKSFVGTCVIGSEKEMPIFKKYMEHYESSAYFKDDGSKYTDTNVVLLTKMLENAGLIRNDEQQIVDSISVFPRTFFSPYDYINGISYITDNSYSIHHFARTWLPKSVRMKSQLKRTAAKIIGAERLAKIRNR